jgi:hypothetical protein
MHNDILTPEQIAILPLLKRFARHFYLVGGTAVALHLGHRRSIDFDLFNARPLKRKRLKTTIEEHFPIQEIFRQNEEEFTVVVNAVKMTFFDYPFEIPHPVHFENSITLPEIVDLAAQLCYFEDLNRNEPIEFIGTEINEADIQQFLTEIALTPF